VNLLADWCERGLKIVVITQQIELNGPVGRMIAAVLLGLAEIELEYRQERQSAGIEVAKKKGVYQGRQRGTTKGKPARAKELLDKGLNAAEIAQALGVSERTVFRYLGEAAR
jgi:predicted transposase/invertase (TIGR01784 family)